MVRIQAHRTDTFSFEASPLGDDPPGYFPVSMLPASEALDPSFKYCNNFRRKRVWPLGPVDIYCNQSSEAVNATKEAKREASLS